MSDEQWVSVNMLKWLTGVLVAIGVWVGAIEQRLRNKPGRDEVARNPVEADTFAAALSEVTTSLDDIKASQRVDSVILSEMGKDVATLMERTK